VTATTQETANTVATAPPAVTVRDLTIVYRTPAGELPAVSGLDLDLPPGTITGLVGESGSGKSTLALSLLGAVQRPGRIAAGSIRVEGLGDLVQLSPASLRAARGAQIGYVFQAAQNSLNPLKTVGKQLLDLGRSHRVKDRAALVRQAKDLLGRMGLDAARVLDSYQHELSGGMRQRVGIMFALVLNAHVLVLDEPTTALDMISQANVLKIVRAVHTERGLTTLLVTHDIGVVAEVAERIAVMYGGVLVEQGETADVLRAPEHPYTRGLINAIPRVSGDLSAARPLPGRPPTLATIPTRGCVFRERCAVYAKRQLAACVAEQPPLAPVAGGSGRLVACHAAGVEDRQATREVTRD
jgi:oligopeptide/dipeptide ABC transporter ATP-binding protein